MRQKEHKVVITFHTTAEAIATETACKEAGLSGRLIPVPRQISSGCGLAFSAPADSQKKLLEVLTTKNLHYDTHGLYLL